MITEYKAVRDIAGPLMLVEATEGVTYNELAQVKMPDGSIRLSQVLEVDGDRALVQIFEGSDGIAPDDVKVRFLGHGLTMKLSKDIVGRVFNGTGEKPSTRARPSCPTRCSTSTATPSTPARATIPTSSSRRASAPSTA